VPNLIVFNEREYKFYGKGIISDEKAMEIYENLLNGKNNPKKNQRTLT